MSSSQDTTLGVGANPSSVGPANTPAGNPSASPVTPGSEQPKCLDPVHYKVGKKLMKLYTASSSVNHDAVFWQHPDIGISWQAIRDLLDGITETHARITEVCEMMQESSPELEMVEAPNEWWGDESDTDSNTSSDDDSSDIAMDEDDSSAGQSERKSSHSNEDHEVEKRRLQAWLLSATSET